MVSIQNKVRLPTASTRHQITERISQNRLGARRCLPAEVSSGPVTCVDGGLPHPGRCRAFCCFPTCVGFQLGSRKSSFGFLLAFTSGNAFVSLFHCWCGPSSNMTSTGRRGKGKPAGQDHSCSLTEVSCLLGGGDWQTKPGVHEHVKNLSLLLKA